MKIKFKFWKDCGEIHETESSLGIWDIIECFEDAYMIEIG